MWQLKTPDGIFNAPDDAKLTEWAEKGRIQPGFELSNDDGKTWVDAATVPFLDMKWSIDIGDGALHGPFNRKAAERLLATGRLAPTARILGPAAELLAQIENLASRLAEAEAHLAEHNVLVQEYGDLKKRFDALENECGTLREELETRTEALENEKRRTFELTGEIERLPANAAATVDIQAAIFRLMKDESDDLDRELAAIRAETEAAAKIRQQRQDRLLKRRRELLLKLGADIGDMTARALSAGHEDPRIQYLRQELEAMKFLQEKGMKDATAKISALSTRLRECLQENERLRQHDADVTTLNKHIAELTQKLQQREKDLLDERRAAAEARKRAEAVEQTVAARIHAVENGTFRTDTDASGASRPASRFPPWMSINS
ncbi:MAG: hypothetical protein IJ802_00010 [Kiritimatiellae bacterium]|nr:hypothetical protein [Kiritimatiellia bacterium]